MVTQPESDDMGTGHSSHHLLRKSTLLIFGLCGLVGILPDIDHIVAYEKGWDYLFVRPWHEPILIASSIVLGACCAYLARSLLQLVLKK